MERLEISWQWIGRIAILHPSIHISSNTRINIDFGEDVGDIYGYTWHDRSGWRSFVWRRTTVWSFCEVNNRSYKCVIPALKSMIEYMQQDSDVKILEHGRIGIEQPSLYLLSRYKEVEKLHKKLRIFKDYNI